MHPAFEILAAPGSLVVFKPPIHACGCTHLGMTGLWKTYRVYPATHAVRNKHLSKPFSRSADFRVCPGTRQGDVYWGRNTSTAELLFLCMRRSADMWTVCHAAQHVAGQHGMACCSGKQAHLQMMRLQQVVRGTQARLQALLPHPCCVLLCCAAAGAQLPRTS